MVEEAEEQKLRGVPMDRDEIDEFLRGQGMGVLALATDNESYALPMSFGYDEERLYFILIRFGDESMKLDFAEETSVATFTTYSFEDEHRWRSVLVRGPIERVPEDRVEAVNESLFDNAQFASLFPQGEPMTERPRHQLTIEEIAGQKGHGYEV